MESERSAASHLPPSLGPNTSSGSAGAVSQPFAWISPSSCPGPIRHSRAPGSPVGAAPARHVLQDVDGGGHREFGADAQARALDGVFARMQHEAAAVLHRAAEMHPPRAQIDARLDLQLRQEVGEAELGRGLVHDQAHRPLRRVGAEEDHRALEAQVAHAGHGDEQLAVQKSGVGRLHRRNMGRFAREYKQSASPLCDCRAGAAQPMVRRPDPGESFSDAPRACPRPDPLRRRAGDGGGRGAAADRRAGRCGGGGGRADPGLASGDGAEVAAVEIRLAPGWHTYWRVPGDAGIPPEFDWSGSSNLAAVAYEWPRPQVFENYGMRTFGYADTLVLPVVLTPERKGEPIEASLAMFFGVCAEVCVPAEARMEARLIGGGTPEGARAHRCGARRAATRPRRGRGRRHHLPARDRGGRAGADRRGHLRGRSRPGQVAVLEPGRPDLQIDPSASRTEGRKVIARARPARRAPGARPLGLRVTVLDAQRAMDIRGCAAPG